jgi:magnesium-transporting ATPase (P-type)
VRAPPPDPFIYEFNNASMRIENYYEFNRKIIQLTSKNLLPRGAKLKNSSFIIGIIVYTGRDTKIMQNSE